MSLVTNISSEELAALQAETAAAPKLKRRFKRAAAPCTLLVPDSKEAVPVCFTEATAPFEVEPLPGRTYGPVFNRDVTREAQARSSQPTPGEKPIPMSDDNLILRMGDGSLVHQTKGCLGTSTRRLG